MLIAASPPPQLRLPGAACVRLQPDAGNSTLLLHLPEESKQVVHDWVLNQPPTCSLPFILSEE